MIVAVAAVRVVQVAADQVIDVIAVRHRGMPAVWPGRVAIVVPAAGGLRCAGSGVLVADRQAVIVDMTVVIVVWVAAG